MKAKGANSGIRTTSAPTAPTAAIVLKLGCGSSNLPQSQSLSLRRGGEGGGGGGGATTYCGGATTYCGGTRSGSAAESSEVTTTKVTGPS